MSLLPPETAGRILMVGCGDLGSRIASLLMRAGHDVSALTRSGFCPDGARVIRADITEAGSLPALADQYTDIVFCVTPSARDEAAYRSVYVDGLRNLLAAATGAQSPRVVFVSSTAVHGPAAGAWLDESSACRPEHFNGRVMREAELVAASTPAASLLLRLGGIYGPGRDSLIRQVVRQQPVGPASLQWGNRIHVDDAAAAAVHLMARVADGVFHIVDATPAPSIEVMDWIADTLNLPRLPRPNEAGPTAGRRISSARLAASGFHWRHADFRSGYRALLDAGLR